MAVKSIPEKGFLTKDSSEVFEYTFDYDEALTAGVQLNGAGTFTITPSTSPGLSQSNPLLLAGNRKAQVLLTGGLYGQTYIIEHTVSTLESPPQTFSSWFRLRIS